MTTPGIFDAGLGRHAANHAPLTPLSFLERTAAVFPANTAVVHGALRRDWAQTYARVRRLAAALRRRGIGPGDTVAALLPNLPEMLELHFAVPMAGAVLNAINVRLDADTVAYILEHGEAEVLFTDREFCDTAADALARLDRPPLTVDVDDPQYEGGRRVGELDYEALLAEGDPEFAWEWPEDEWQAIALNYTSGTTGRPKGVVYHHRGAYLNAIGNVLTWSMGHAPVYLWTLPMFHCNGWCFPWTVTALAGTHVCLRHVRPEAVLEQIRSRGVTHLCGAPVVLNGLVNAPEALRAGIHKGVRIMTAAAAPPAAVIGAVEAMGFEVTHVYGLTEVYGPVTVCDWHPEWDAEPLDQRARLKARQGVRYVTLEGLAVAHPESLEPVPADGAAIGEILMRGNTVMKGYLKDPEATEKAFAGGWFHTGDLAVRHPDGYLEIMDRTKDIIISGGENISTIEVEGALYRHPAVLEAAVVAKPHPEWGETPCAFVTLKADAGAIGEDEIIEFCRTQIARFKAPTRVVFTELPKTSTGKIQKFRLRELARTV